VAATAATLELQVAGVRLDIRTRRAEVAGREVELTAKEFTLLETFLRHPGQVLSREQLLSHVWGYDFDPGSNVVDVYVDYLRRKLRLGSLRDRARHGLPHARSAVAAYSGFSGSRDGSAVSSNAASRPVMAERAPHERRALDQNEPPAGRGRAPLGREQQGVAVCGLGGEDPLHGRSLSVERTNAPTWAGRAERPSPSEPCRS